jgi:hypothetical protein
MKLRLTGTLVLVLGIAALASASAYAGNGHGNGNDGKNDQAAPAASASADARGNSGNVPGQLKKDDAPAPAAVVAEQPAVEAAQQGVKPANDTAKDTYEAASSDKTKEYGNGKTAGQIAIQNGAAPSTVLHGPGNSQPHKASPCSGGHEVDVHALKGKRGKGCGSQPPSDPPHSNPDPPHSNPDPPHSIPDPGKPGDPARGPDVQGTPSVPSTPGKPKPAVDPEESAVAGAAAGVLGATGAIGSGTLPFTGFPIWIVVLIALGLIGLGVILRRRSGVSSS